jgi:hypothetical protein
VFPKKNRVRTDMKTIKRISTAAFLAGVTTLAVTLPMPPAAQAGQGLNQPATSAQPGRDDRG